MNYIVLLIVCLSMFSCTQKSITETSQQEKQEETKTSTKDYAEPPHIELINVRWILRELNGNNIKSESAIGDVYLNFRDAALLEGFGGCNKLSGTYKSTETTIKIGPLASTRMSCEKDKVESEFSQALEAAETYITDSKYLYLKNKDNKVVAKLEAVYL